MQRLSKDTTVFMMCDVQERFRDVIYKFNAVALGARRMARGAGVLGVPLIVTEQYPKGLGHTVAEIDLAPAGKDVHEKTCFSMLCPGVKARLGELKPTDAVVFGLEAHVCVQQTVLDLLAMGCNVHLCVDAISSQQQVDRSVGLRRAERAGALLTSTESVLMELIRAKEHESFKAISGILKETKSCAVGEVGLEF